MTRYGADQRGGRQVGLSGSDKPAFSPREYGSVDTAAIRIHLDELLARHEMTLTQLSERAGVTIANLSILKNGHGRAIRFSTLAKLCDALNCQPGDLLVCEPTAAQWAEE